VCADEDTFIGLDSPNGFLLERVESKLIFSGCARLSVYFPLIAFRVEDLVYTIFIISLHFDLDIIEFVLIVFVIAISTFVNYLIFVLSSFVGQQS
jgi:hypothetical protein